MDPEQLAALGRAIETRDFDSLSGAWTLTVSPFDLAALSRPVAPSINTRALADELLAAMISDNGKGDEGQLTRADPGPGVGRTLMTAFARQLRGRTEFRKGPDGGVSVFLAFPAPESMGEAPEGGNRRTT